MADAAARWGVAAAAVGTLHSAFSIYWALGGDGLINTVGGTPADLAETGGATAAVVAGLAAAGKLAVALLPLVLFLGMASRVARGRLRLPVRIVAWLLIVWGGVSMIGAALGLLGVGGTKTAAQHTALLGHLVGWDLAFLVWGLLLLKASQLERMRHRLRMDAGV